jgi:methylenetetrahydrofolate reductase (NADPH)
VAGYPEKHFEAPNLTSDIKWLKSKIELGGEYIVTQMFFNNQAYFDFVDRCRAEGITVPIIPGLKPLSTKKQLSLLPSIFHVDIPEALAEACESCKTDADVKQVGIEWCIQQSKELVQFGAPVLHYYSMGKSDAVRAVAAQVF